MNLIFSYPKTCFEVFRVHEKPVRSQFRKEMYLIFLHFEEALKVLKDFIPKDARRSGQHQGIPQEIRENAEGTIAGFSSELNIQLINWGFKISEP